MRATDPLPALVARFQDGSARGAELLTEFRRNVARVAARYPAAWFALGQRGDEALDDLTSRVFTICARVAKGRFPFLSRTPFATYVAEAFDGRAIRYHSFYAKLSITRETMRADYAHNLASDPRLVWRADLYGEIGDVLRTCAVADERRPPRWAVPGPSMVRPREVVMDTLRDRRVRDVAALVPEALRMGGPRTQSELCALIEEVLGPPEAPRAEAPIAHPAPWEVSTVRAAVLAGWAALDAQEQALLRGLADGLSYDELSARIPAFAHKVAVHRALERVGKEFVGRIEAAVGGAATELPPRQLLELVLDVLGEVAP